MSTQPPISAPGPEAGALVTSPEPGRVVVDLTPAKGPDLADVVSDVLAFIVKYIYAEDSSVSGTAHLLDLHVPDVNRALARAGVRPKSMGQHTRPRWKRPKARRGRGHGRLLVREPESAGAAMTVASRAPHAAVPRSSRRMFTIDLWGELPAYDDAIGELRADLLAEAMRRADGNQSDAAELLGISRSRINDLLGRRRPSTKRKHHAK